MTTCSANDLKETALRARNMATTTNIHLVGRVWGQSLRGKDKAKDKGPRGNDLTFSFSFTAIPSQREYEGEDH